MDLISLAFVIVILIIVILLRKEIPKIVEWLVSFRRITKNEKGFSLEGSSETQMTIRSKSKEIKELDTQLEKKDEKEEDQKNDYFLLYIQKKYDKSLTLLNKLIDDTVDEEKSIRLKSMKGLVQYSINREGAIQHFQELIKLHPNNYIPFYWYAQAYYWNNNYNKSLEVVEEGLKSVTEKSQLITVKVNCLNSMGESEKAKETLIAAINDKNDIPNHYLLLCELLENDPSSAYKWFQAGLLKFSEDEELRKKFAAFLEINNKNDEALLHYLKLTSINPKSPEYSTLLGNSYLDNGLNDKALIAYKKANELAIEKESWIISNIGNIYNNQGFYTEAISYLKKALEITPDSEYCHDRFAKALKSKKEEDVKEDKILLEARKKNQFNEK